MTITGLTALYLRVTVTALKLYGTAAGNEK